MSQSLATEELAKQFGFGPLSETATRLVQLVAQRGAGVDEVAEVVRQDPNLAARLLRMMSAGAPLRRSGTPVTVEEILLRQGMGPAILLGATEPLLRAIAKTFYSLLGARADEINSSAFPGFARQFVAEVEFAGGIRGKMDFRFTEDAAMALAAKIAGSAAPAHDADLPGRVSEIVTIIASNFQAALAEAGVKCILEAPAVERTTDFHKRIIAGGVGERTAIRSGDVLMVIDLSVNPWNE